MRNAVLYFLLLLCLVASPSARAAEKMDKVWLVNQGSNWGKSTVKVCAEGIRIEAVTGTIMVARAPNWDVVLYRKGQKQASKTPYAKFIKKYPVNVHAENFRGEKHKVKIAGAGAVQYVLPYNKRLDTNDGIGHTFRAKIETPFVTNMVMTVADNSVPLPPQVLEIWRTYFEFSFIQKAPLEFYMVLGDGTKHFQFQTFAQKVVNLPASEFDHPKDLQYTAEFMQMIYGKKMEDVADLLMSP